MNIRYQVPAVCARNHGKWKLLRGERLHLCISDGNPVIVNKYGMIVAASFAYNIPEQHMMQSAGKGRSLYVSEVRDAAFRAEFAKSDYDEIHPEWNAY